ncbi:glycoside hydrolase family 3 N-terminal domain-containing protein [Corynebacterium choanae]|uniref:beta-N-acetylhexosaminidase n=1 Tax=Corynebacterium choanae TaxID=1862358 RepID=A0A3G6J3V0_9CORY|nr:glycoside hydrolase family 3 N-terminal domain-containing protein [Corynebacterium choanae]AZA12609.1 putative lipoprotein YbbD precursor [Corynebacterium choanae]
MQNTKTLVAVTVVALALAAVSYPGWWHNPTGDHAATALAENNHSPQTHRVDDPTPSTTSAQPPAASSRTTSSPTDATKATGEPHNPAALVAAHTAAKVALHQSTHPPIAVSALGIGPLLGPLAAFSSAAEIPLEHVPYPHDRRARIASLMMVGVRDYDDALWALQQGAGGIFIGSWTDPQLLTQQGRDLHALKKQVGRSFQVSIDAEGGRVARQPDIFGQLPSPRQMAATMTPQQVEQVAFELGQKLHDRGVTVDFAPVVDIDGGPAGGAIGDRSFSDDPVIAGRYATAFSRGLQRAGVIPVVKHFPGHGRASGDSHTGQVFTPPITDLKQHDLTAYNQPLAETQAQVMVGHVTATGLSDGNTPSTVNPAVYELLRRGDWQGGAPYHGVIFTDDLSGMKAISDSFTLPQAVLGALRAGADMPLWIATEGLNEAIDAVDRAVADGSYPERMLNQSASRVAALPRW